MRLPKDAKTWGRSVQGGPCAWREIHRGSGRRWNREKVLYQGSGPNPESQGGLTIKDTPPGVGSWAEAGSPAWRPVQ